MELVSRKFPSPPGLGATFTVDPTRLAQDLARYLKRRDGENLVQHQAASL